MKEFSGRKWKENGEDGKVFSGANERRKERAETVEKENDRGKR